jgi:hypothetical protein
MNDLPNQRPLFTRVIATVLTAAMVVTMPGMTALAYDNVTSPQSPNNAYKAPLSKTNKPSAFDTLQANVPANESLQQIEAIMANGSPNYNYVRQASISAGVLKNVNSPDALPTSGLQAPQADDLLNRLIQNTMTGADNANLVANTVLGKIAGADFTDLPMIPQIQDMIDQTRGIAQREVDRLELTYRDWYTAQLADEDELDAIHQQEGDILKQINELKSEKITAEARLASAKLNPISSYFGSYLPVVGKYVDVKGLENQIKDIDYQLNEREWTTVDGKKSNGLYAALNHLTNELEPKIKLALKDDTIRVRNMVKPLTDLQTKYGSQLDFKGLAQLQLESRESLNKGLKIGSATTLPTRDDRVTLATIASTVNQYGGGLTGIGASIGMGVVNALRSETVKGAQQATQQATALHDAYIQSLARGGTGELQRRFDLAHKIANIRAKQVYTDLVDGSAEKVLQGLMQVKANITQMLAQTQTDLSAFSKLAKGTLKLDSAQVSPGVRAWVASVGGVQNIQWAVDGYAQSVERSAFNKFETIDPFAKRATSFVQTHLQAMNEFDTMVDGAQAAASNAVQNTVMMAQHGSQIAKDTLNQAGIPYLNSNGAQYDSVSAWQSDSAAGKAQSMGQFVGSKMTLANNITADLSLPESFALHGREGWADLSNSVSEFKTTWETNKGLAMLEYAPGIAAKAGALALGTVAFIGAPEIVAPILTIGGAIATVGGTFGSGIIGGMTSSDGNFAAGFRQDFGSTTVGAASAFFLPSIGATFRTATASLASFAEDFTGAVKGVSALRAAATGAEAMSFRTAAGTAFRVAFAPARLIADAAAPLVPASFSLYGFQTVANNSLTAEGLFGALTAPVDSITAPMLSGIHNASIAMFGDGLVTKGIDMVAGAEGVAADVATFKSGASIAKAAMGGLGFGEATGKVVTNLAMNVPMVNFYQGQINNWSDAFANGTYGKAITGTVQMALGVAGAGGSFSAKALTEQGLTSQAEASAAIPGQIARETVKLMGLSVTGQFAPNLAIAGGMGEGVAGHYAFGNRPGTSLQDSQVQEIVSRYGAQSLLTASPAPLTDVRSFSDIQRYTANGQVLTAAASQLLESGNPVDRAFVSALGRGADMSTLDGTTLQPQTAVIRAANQAIFNDAAPRLDLNQLADLSAGRVITTQDGLNLNGAKIDQTAVSRGLVDAAVKSEDGVLGILTHPDTAPAVTDAIQRAVLDVAGRTGGTLPDGVTTEDISLVRTAQLEAARRTGGDAVDILMKNAAQARERGQEGLANQLENLAAEQNYKAKVDALQTIVSQLDNPGHIALDHMTSDEAAKVLRANAAVDAAKAKLLDSQYRLDYTVPQEHVQQAHIQAQQSQSRADRATDIDKANTALKLAEYRVKSSETESLAEQTAATAARDHAQNLLELAKLRQQQAAELAVVDGKKFSRTEQNAFRNAAAALQVKIDGLAARTNPLKTLSEGYEALKENKPGETATAAAKVNAAKLELARLDIEKSGLIARVKSQFKMTVARAAVSLQLVGAVSGVAPASMAQPLNLNSRTTQMDVAIDGSPASFTGGLRDYVKLEQARQQVKDFKVQAGAVSETKTAIEKAETAKAIADRIAELNDDARRLGGLTAADQAEFSYLTEQSKAISNGDPIKDQVSRDNDVDALRRSATAQAFKDGVGNDLESVLPSTLEEGLRSTDASREISALRIQQAEALKNAADAKSRAGAADSFTTRRAATREAREQTRRAESIAQQIEQAQRDAVNEHYDAQADAINRDFNTLKKDLQGAKTSKQPISGDLAARLHGKSLSGKSSNSEIEAARKTKLEANEARRESSLAATEFKQALARGDNAKAHVLANKYLTGGADARSQVETKQFMEDIKEGLPGHRALTFLALKDGKALYDQMIAAKGTDLEKATTDKFNDWLKKDSENRETAMTRTGFENTWDYFFGEKTVDQANSELTQALGSVSPEDYVRERQQAVNVMFLEKGLTPDTIKLLGDRSADGSRANEALNELLKGKTGVERVVLARLFAGKILEGMFNSPLRVGQDVGINLFAEGLNAIVDAGGGKTEVFMVDQVIHSIINRDLYRGEILVESAAAANKYVNRGSIVALAKAFGVKLVDGTELQRNHDTAGLIKAFNDPHTLVILDPETRGHLMNEAFTNPELRLAMQRSNIVGYDEIHFAATNRTSAIIGADMRAPEAARVNRITGLYHELNTTLMSGPNGDLRLLADKGFHEARSAEEFNGIQKDLNANGELGVIKFNGQLFASNALLAKLDLRTYTTGEIKSVLWALTTSKDSRDGYAIGKDDKGVELIYPVNSFGRTEYSQISNDVNAQIAVALKEGLNPESAVRVQRTSMSSSLASVFENPYARKVGGSATLKGLDALLQSRIGAKAINVSGTPLELNFLLNVDGKSGINGLGQGSIRQFTNAGFDLNNQAHFDSLVEEIRAKSKEINVVIATDSPEMIQKLAKALNVSEDRIIDGNIADDKVNKIAAPVSYKDLGIKEGQPLTQEQTDQLNGLLKGNITIINPRAYTGADFQQNAALYALGAEKLGEQDMVQLLKRLNRPIGDPKLRDAINTMLRGQGVPELSERWVATREMILTSQSDLEATLKFAEEKAATGELGRIFKFQGNTRGLELIAKATDANEMIKSSQLDLSERIELNAFARQALINSEAAKFAVQDALREEYVIKPLKDALSKYAKGTREYNLINRVLDNTLNGNGADYSPLKAEDFAKQLTSGDYLKNVFTQVSMEARHNLAQIEQGMSWRSDAGLKRWIAAEKGNVADFNEATARFSTLKERQDISFAKARTAMDRLGVIKYAQKMILTGETSVQASNVQAAQAAESAWNAVQEAIKGVQPTSGMGLRLYMNSPTSVPLSGVRSVAAALSRIDISALPLGSYRRNILADLMTAGNISELQGKLSVLGRTANTGANGIYLSPATPLNMTSAPSGIRQTLVGWNYQLTQNNQTALTALASNLIASLNQPEGLELSPAVSAIHQNALRRLRQLIDNPKVRPYLMTAIGQAVAAMETKVPLNRAAISEQNLNALKDIRTLASDKLKDLDTDAVSVRRGNNGSIDVTVRDEADPLSGLLISLALDQAGAGRRVHITRPSNSSPESTAIARQDPIVEAIRQINDRGGHVTLSAGDAAPLRVRTTGFTTEKRAAPASKPFFGVSAFWNRPRLSAIVPTLKLDVFQAALTQLRGAKNDADKASARAQVDAIANDVIANAHELTRVLDRRLVTFDEPTARMIRRLAQARSAADVSKALDAENHLPAGVQATLAADAFKGNSAIVDALSRGEQPLFVLVEPPAEPVNPIEAFRMAFRGRNTPALEQALKTLMDKAVPIDFDTAFKALTAALKPLIPHPGKPFRGDGRLAVDIAHAMKSAFTVDNGLYVVSLDVNAEFSMIRALKPVKPDARDKNLIALIAPEGQAQYLQAALQRLQEERNPLVPLRVTIVEQPDVDAFKKAAHETVQRASAQSMDTRLPQALRYTPSFSEAHPAMVQNATSLGNAVVGILAMKLVVPMVAVFVGTTLPLVAVTMGTVLVSTWVNRRLGGSGNSLYQMKPTAVQRALIAAPAVLGLVMIPTQIGAYFVGHQMSSNLMYFSQSISGLSALMTLVIARLRYERISRISALSTKRTASRTRRSIFASVAPTPVTGAISLPKSLTTRTVSIAAAVGLGGGALGYLIHSAMQAPAAVTTTPVLADVQLYSAGIPSNWMGAVAFVASWVLLRYMTGKPIVPDFIRTRIPAYSSPSGWQTIITNA